MDAATTGSLHRRAVTVLAAAVVLVAAVLLGHAGGDPSPWRATPVATTTVPAGPTTPSSSPTTTSTTAPTTTTAAPTTTTTTTTVVGSLATGDRGPAVTWLESRLAGLGYWLGAPDEVFDDVTAHAVVAFQKVHGLARDGVAGPAVQAALAGAAPPRPRSPSGHVLEIDRTRQVLLVARDGATTTVLDISTGRVPGSTPAGHFRVTRQIDGYRRSPLGVLYRPKYFHEGVAIHGYPSVPPFPASHGCVRTTNPAMDWLWASGEAPVGTAVWVYD